MTRVVIVGEMYNADLQVGGGPVYPSGPAPRPPGPVDPGYSPPWARPPVDPGWGVTPPVDPSWGVRPPVDPGYSPPWARPQPPGIWGGPVDPGWSTGIARPMPPIYFPPEPGTPEHPIVLPPDLPSTTPEGRPIEWKTGWTAATGWIVVGIPQVPVPTPA